MLRRKPYLLLLDALWLLLLGIYILAGTALVPFHGDEATLTYMGRDYHYQFVQGDLRYVRHYDLLASTQAALRHPDAQHLATLINTLGLRLTDQDLRLLNGTIPKYMYGFVSASMGYTPETINEQWLWGAGWDYNTRNGHMPDAELLYRSRLASALTLVAALCALFVLARHIGGRGTAYLTTLYLAFSPALLMVGRRAMMESQPLLFGFLVVLAGLWLIADWQRSAYRIGWRSIGLYALLGTVSGLAVAAKHTSVVTVAPIFFALGGVLLLNFLASCASWRFKPAIKRPYFLQHMACLTFAGLLSLLVFYALNPAWWGDPLGRVRDVLALRTDLLAGQTSAFGSYSGFADQVAGFLRQVWVAQPMYSEAPFFLAYIPDQIAAYAASPWAGVPIGGSVVGAVLLGAVWLFGFVAFVRNAEVHRAARWLIVMWTAATFAFTLLLTPLEWQRYYIPALPLVGLFAAYGLTRAIQGVLSWRRIARANPNPTPSS